MGRTDTKLLVNEVLSRIGSAGIMGQTIEANTALEALDALQTIPDSVSPITKKRLIHEIRRQELMTFTQDTDSMTVQLSVKGIHRLQKHEIESMAIPVMEKWDGCWRMVMYDIPARHAESRYLLTSNLKRLGFVMIQGSVWAHPYPCFEIISRLTTYANLTQFVTVAGISQLDKSTERKLHRKFSPKYQLSE